MSDTKDKIVTLADHLVRTKGFNAFSYKDIADPMEIKNAAIHYHFPAKADLGICVIDNEIDKFRESVEKWRKLPEDKQLTKLVEVFHRHGTNGFICLMGSLAPDFETFTDPMKAKVQEMGNVIVSWITGCLENGRAGKRFHFEGEAYDRALLIITNLQSSLILSRVLGPSVFNRVSNRILKDLKP
ncbi:TetR family transcriptional regulator [Chitinophaga sp. SYP-B3965]|uniref:TetR/AcrR family transcriptional regulator n=1 Tax=Chitinophaga sp. SYP-B3965 TaxID=2663120 RepID=UPI001299E637|nr:TetR/AcrR family transcriptional regulator [Chitinophaga sp. SYP-B3965]MRG48469.1 TetR family transcriptional regulator [Chitinophaga sp. SYP-B3965]